MTYPRSVHETRRCASCGRTRPALDSAMTPADLGAAPSAPLYDRSARSTRSRSPTSLASGSLLYTNRTNRSPFRSPQ